MPVALEPDTMLRDLRPNATGIWRPPELVVFFAPTLASSMSSSHAELQAERPITVRKNQSYPRLEHHAGCDEDGLVSGAADLKEVLL